MLCIIERELWHVTFWLRVYTFWVPDIYKVNISCQLHQVLWPLPTSIRGGFHLKIGSLWFYVCCGLSPQINVTSPGHKIMSLLYQMVTLSNTGLVCYDGGEFHKKSNIFAVRKKKEFSFNGLGLLSKDLVLCLCCI